MTEIRLDLRAIRSTVHMSRFGAGVLLAAFLLIAAPTSALAQGAASGTPAAQPQSPSTAQQAVSPSASAQASASSSPVAANPQASAPASAKPEAQAPAAPPAASAKPGEPVGANPPQEKQEPISLFAYLLIVLAGLWLLYMAGNVLRLSVKARRQGGPLPPAERGRSFLSFVMPFIVFACVAAVVIAWGELFLALARMAEEYTLAADLVVILAVMFIATAVALRSGGSRGSAIH